MLLCPVDFSPATVALVRTAAGLARTQPDASLTLLYVAPAAQSADEQRGVAGQLAELQQLPELAGLTVTTTIGAGCASRVITQQAAALGASCIVLGAHGVSGVTRFLVGSTAEAVLRTAACPTLLLTVPSVG